MILLHIGYPKSASSTLQKHLFDKHSRINSFSSYPVGNVGTDTKLVNHSSRYLSNRSLRELYQQLAIHDEQKYDNQLVKNIIKSVSDEIVPDKCNVFSSEFITSVFFTVKNQEIKAKRLYSHFPNAKILVVVRNQFDIIKSQYKDHPFDPCDLIKGIPVSLNEYISKLIQHESSIQYLGSLYYYENIEIYRKLFGRENVCVLCMEDLKSDTLKFTQNLSCFLAIDQEECFKLLSNQHENKGTNYPYLVYRQRVRKYLVYKAFNFFVSNVLQIDIRKYLPTSKKEEIINAANVEKLSEMFSLSNHKLGKEYGVNVEKYEYPTTPQHSLATSAIPAV